MVNVGQLGQELLPAVVDGCQLGDYVLALALHVQAAQGQPGQVVSDFVFAAHWVCPRRVQEEMGVKSLFRARPRAKIEVARLLA
jgi:hypothetical protein